MAGFSTNIYFQGLFPVFENYYVSNLMTDICDEVRRRLLFLNSRTKTAGILFLSLAENKSEIVFLSSLSTSSLIMRNRFN